MVDETMGKIDRKPWVEIEGNWMGYGHFVFTSFKLVSCMNIMSTDYSHQEKSIGTTGCTGVRTIDIQGVNLDQH